MRFRKGDAGMEVFERRNRWSKEEKRRVKKRKKASEEEAEKC